MFSKGKKPLRELTGLAAMAFVFALFAPTFVLGQDYSPQNGAHPQAYGQAVPQPQQQPSNSLYNWENSHVQPWATPKPNTQYSLVEFKNQVKQAILTACAYPPLKKGQPDKIVELSVYIDNAGEIGNIGVSNSSGHKQFDAAVILAAKRVSTPLSPPDGKGITLQITFKNSDLGVVESTKAAH